MRRLMNWCSEGRLRRLVCWLGGVSGGALLLSLQGCTPEGGGPKSPSDPLARQYKLLNEGTGDSSQEPPRLQGLQLCSEEYDEELGKRVCVYKTDCDDPDADVWIDEACDGFDLRNPKNPHALRPDFTFCREITFEGRRACIYQRNCDEENPMEYQIDFECDGEKFIGVTVMIAQKYSRPPVDLAGCVDCEYDRVSGVMVLEFEPGYSSPVILPRRGNLKLWEIRTPEGVHEERPLTSGEIKAGARIRIKGTMSDMVHWMYAMGVRNLRVKARGVVIEAIMPSTLPVYEIRMDGLVIEEVWVESSWEKTADATAQDER